jgi:hypothetical protein
VNSPTVITVKLGHDGRRYLHPPLTESERQRARRLEHALIHRDRLSIREAQRVLLESYGLRRSIGVIFRDLADWSCPSCPDRQP